MSTRAAHVVRDHCLAPERVDAPISSGRYRALLPDLPGLRVAEEALHALGRPGGPCDVGVDFGGGDDSAVAAVWPFFGQFVAHDASLANRDLQRGQAVGLPSGEAVARALGLEPLSSEQVGLATHGWTEETPLWLYILKEAEALHEGDRLGPVGGRIVGEVLIGLIDADPESFRELDPGWTPTLDGHVPGTFGLADILVPVPAHPG
jgi:hypothetical protein